MNQVHVVGPGHEEMTLDKAVALAAQGWHCLTGVNVGSGVITPNNPMGQGKVDLWIAPIANVPLSALASLFISAEENGGDSVTLNALCQALFGMSLREVRTQMGASPVSEAENVVQFPGRRVD